jgi:hypothetical protein
MLGGRTYGSGSGLFDMLLMKIDSVGNPLWSKTYGEGSSENCFSMVHTIDGGYALAGRTTSFGSGGYDMYLVKTDSVGNLLWQRTYGWAGSDGCRSVKQTMDGGYILGGYANDPHDMYLVKTDSEGNLQWQRTFGGSGDDWCYDVQQTVDGGYILAGQYVPAGSHCQAWLLKTDSNGYQIWSQLFGGEEVDKFYTVELTGDGGYIGGGYTESFGSSTQMYLVKTNSLGIMQWQNNYGGEWGDACHTILLTPDDGYLLTGNWFNIYKVDSSGNQLWWTDPTWVVGAFAYGMCPSNDGGVVLAGEADYGDDILVIKISGLQQAWFNLQPSNPPITIPAQGGSFQFTATLTNCGTIPCNPQVWIMVRLPSGQTYGPVLGPYSIPLDTSAVLSRVRNQNVPASAPPGVYTYKAYVGTYNTAKWDSSSFTFTKLSDSGLAGMKVLDWSCTGDPFPGEEFPPLSSDDPNPPLIKGGRGDLVAASPNPFNPSTTICYELRAASHVSLKVFDTTGRDIATLVNGFRDAGQHTVTFDGRNLPSGIYLYSLKAGQNTASGKLLLLK